MAISKDQIFKAADDLDAAGQNPTLAAVRKVLGGGSFTTISEAMNEWRASKNAQAVPIKEPAPAAVLDKFAVLGAEIWAVALEMANSRLNAEREALEASRIEFDMARQEAAELADQLTAELDQANESIALLGQSVSAGNQREQELVQKLAAANERASNSDARAIELRAELDHAHAQIKEAQGKNEGLRDMLTETSSKIESLRADLAAAQKRAEKSDKQAESTTALLVEARGELKVAAAENTKLLTRISTLDGELVRSQAECGRALADAAKLPGIESELAAARNLAAVAREEAAKLSGQLQATQEMLSRVTTKEPKPSKG